MYGGAKRAARWMRTFSAVFTDRRAAVAVTLAAAAPLCQKLLYINGGLAELKAPTGARRALGWCFKLLLRVQSTTSLWTAPSISPPLKPSEWPLLDSTFPSIGSARRPLGGFITSTDAALLKQLLPDWFCFHCCRRLLLSGLKMLVAFYRLSKMDLIFLLDLRATFSLLPPLNGSLLICSVFVTLSQ